MKNSTSKYFFNRPSFLKACFSVSVMSALLGNVTLEPFGHLFRSTSITGIYTLLTVGVINVSKSNKSDLNIFTTPIKLPTGTEKAPIKTLPSVKKQYPVGSLTHEEIRELNYDSHSTLITYDQPLPYDVIVMCRKTPKIKGYSESESFVHLQCLLYRDEFYSPSSFAGQYILYNHDQDQMKALSAFNHPTRLKKGDTILGYLERQRKKKVMKLEIVKNVSETVERI